MHLQRALIQPRLCRYGHVVVLLAGLSACGEVGHGSDAINQQSLELLQVRFPVGQSTKKDVLEQLRTPTVRSASGDTDIWIYRFDTQGTLFAPARRKEATFYFDRASSRLTRIGYQESAR